jgi:hypothetical protein
MRNQQELYVRSVAALRAKADIRRVAEEAAPRARTA